MDVAFGAQCLHFHVVEHTTWHQPEACDALLYTDVVNNKSFPNYPQDHLALAHTAVSRALQAAFWGLRLSKTEL